MPRATSIHSSFTLPRSLHNKAIAAQREQGFKSFSDLLAAALRGYLKEQDLSRQELRLAKMLQQIRADVKEQGKKHEATFALTVAATKELLAAGGMKQAKLAERMSEILQAVENDLAGNEEPPHSYLSLDEAPPFDGYETYTPDDEEPPF